MKSETVVTPVPGKRPADHKAVLRYFHQEIPELSGGFLKKGNVQVTSLKEIDSSEAMEVAVVAMSMAARLGIRMPASDNGALPYSKDSDALLFSAPLTSATLNKKILYLRGWKQFESCVKGFNSLGLMADQVLRVKRELSSLEPSQLDALKLEYLRTRLVPSNGADVARFSASDLECLDPAELLEISTFELSIWKAFANKTIVCSTSSNMGISLHQVLRLMQSATMNFRGKSFTLLNSNEGSLVIWCPDERADFMNIEKTRLLRGLETELPPLTRLRTYINRQQRDPGALGDALRSGGYFFPTNPQSQEEMQNLIFVALKELSAESGMDATQLLKKPEIVETLKSLGCTISQDRIMVESGVEGGIFGLMIPYLIAIEEFLRSGQGNAISVWNQASIGAALAAAVIGDRILRDPSQLKDHVRAEFNSLFPTMSQFLDTKSVGKDLKTQVHGVFDIANLQSLAQLLGVVVQNHMTGRGTAFVGLGSSSYSNGNRCFEILQESIESSGAFRGKDAFHPATHTINPIAQAMVFGEDLCRYLGQRPLSAPFIDAHIAEILAQVKKPEPAGAAALGGYLLARLDARTLSALEVAYMLRLVGFTRDTFLEFAGYGPRGEGLQTFLQLAFEEGPIMSSFAQDMVVLLDWKLKDLEARMKREKNQSRLSYWRSPVDPLEFEHSDNYTALYLTGDNTGQPSPQLAHSIVMSCIENQSAIEAYASLYAAADVRKQLGTTLNVACSALSLMSRCGNAVNQKVDSYSKRMIQKLIMKGLGSTA